MRRVAPWHAGRTAGFLVAVVLGLARGGDRGASRHGIYDLSANTGWVSVGTDHDTSAFAVEILRRWCHTDGKHRYQGADRLLVCADGGAADGSGSNGYRVRAWKMDRHDFHGEWNYCVARRPDIDPP